MKRGKYIIVADAGSTKTDWLIHDISASGKESGTLLTTSGINGVTSSENYINVVLDDLIAKAKEQLPEFQPNSVKALYFYGAGCATPEICDYIAELIKGKLGAKVPVEVASDMLGAARAIFGRKDGIACILGTGSNSCLYKKGEIVANVPSLGFILGDEGSGVALGKRLLRDIYRGVTPRDIARAFHIKYKLDYKEVLERIYRQPSPNAFLASFVPFLEQHSGNSYVRSLIKEEFRCFIRNTVNLYPDSHNYNLGFAGSVAFLFGEILAEVALDDFYGISRIIRKPIDGILRYHIENQ